MAASVGTVLMDFSKAYECLSQDLLTAKLEVSRLDVGSLNFVLYYLSLRKHRTKVGASNIKWSKICRGMPQGSISGPLFNRLFNIFISDISFSVENSEICNFADDNVYIHVEKIFLKLKMI